jgi:protein-S-isoprenylcysteine O-methyltransferase Ste14
MTPWLSFFVARESPEKLMGNEPPRQPVSDATTAGVIARPPFLFLAALLLGLVLDYVLPLPLVVPAADLARWVLGGCMIVGGFALAGAGIRNFSRAATPVPTYQPVRALVTTGVNGWTRNPIYVGMFLIYAGIGVAAGSPWMFVLLLPLALTMRIGVVAREEAYLERLFGDAYRDYKARVRRWV